MLPLHKLAGSLWTVLKQSLTEWVDDNAARYGASFAFYALLSLVPGLVIVVAIAAFAFGEQAAQGHLVSQIRDFVGEDVAAAIQSIIKGAFEHRTGTITTVFGALTLAFGASSAFVELYDALNIIWHVPVRHHRTETGTVLEFLKDRLYSFAVVVGSGLLLLISLLFSDLGRGMGWPLPRTTKLIFTFGVILGLFAAAYKNVPDVKVKWADVLPGATLTAILFLAGKHVVSIYFLRSGAGSGYGASSSPLVVLLWVYYSALLFFWGAEFTKVYTHVLGSRAGMPIAREHSGG